MKKQYLDYAGLKRVLKRLLPGARKIWHGTEAEWEALSETERDKYDQAEVIDADPSEVPMQYSTEEQYTGKKWIDGKKIYRKVFEPGNITATNKLLSVPDIKEVTNLIFRRRYDNRAGTWTFDSNGNTNGYLFSYDTGGITLNVISSNVTLYDCMVILEYTKTTD